MTVYFKGSLRRRMNDYWAAGQGVAVLLIDEQGSLPLDTHRYQLQVLEEAELLSMPIYQIELNPTLGKATQQPNVPTMQLLRRRGARLITKGGFNAFHDCSPNLEDRLRWDFIKAVVVMGFASEQCVKHTAIGGYKDRERSVYQTGAKDLGFVVLTSERVIRGPLAHQPVSWKHVPGVEFYDWV